MKDAIAMFMICVSSLGGIEGQISGPPVGMMGGGVGLPVNSEIPGKAVYHGEALIIGSSIRLSHGAEDFVYPAENAPEIVYRHCFESKDHCDPTNTALSGGGDKGRNNYEENMVLPANGLCKAFRHTKVASAHQTQEHPIMPGYTICGHKTQLTVYPTDATCGANSINYKTIGHCDNSASAMTQCWSIYSAHHDRLHAETAAYKLTPCNFNAEIQPAPIGPEGQVYRGAQGQEGGGANGPIKGSDIEQSEVVAWQEQMAP